MNYSSKVWSVLFYVAVGVWFVTTFGDPVKLHLNATLWEWMRIVATAVGFFTGKVGQSWLKAARSGEADAAPAAARLAPVILLALVLPLSLSSAGCAWFQKKPTVDAQQAAYEQVKKAADVVNAAGQVVASAQQMEIALYQSGSIPQPAHLAIQQGFKTMAQQVQSGLVVLRDLTKTPMEQQAAITQIGTSMSTFVASLPGLSDDVKTKIVALMNGAVLMVQGALLMT